MPDQAPQTALARAGGPATLPHPSDSGLAHLGLAPLADSDAYSGAPAPGPSLTFSYNGASRPPNTFQQVQTHHAVMKHLWHHGRAVWQHPGMHVLPACLHGRFSRIIHEFLQLYMPKSSQFMLFRFCGGAYPIVLSSRPFLSACYSAKGCRASRGVIITVCAVRSRL